jgi:hypothetical protein
VPLVPADAARAHSCDDTQMLNHDSVSELVF